MIEDQSRKIEQRIDALLLVGGFAGSEYLFRKVEVSSGAKRLRDDDRLNVFRVVRPSFRARLRSSAVHLMLIRRPCEGPRSTDSRARRSYQR